MKKFNKVLAALLSLVMLFTLLPAAAFAADPGGSTAAGGTGAAGGSSGDAFVTWEEPEPDGTGADGTVTLHLNAQKLLEALKSEGSLRDMLVQVLQALIERNGSVITKDELRELIPVDNIMELLLGADNEKVPDLIEQLGGIDEVKGMLDLGALVNSVDSQALVDFVTTIENISEYINADELFALDIDWDLELAFDYVDQEKLEARFDELSYDELVDLVGGDASNLKQIVYFEEMMRELLDRELIDPAEAADLDALKKNEIIRNAIIEAVRANYEAYLTEAGIAKVEDKIMESVGADDLSADVFESEEKLRELAEDLTAQVGADVSDYLNPDGSVNTDLFLTNFEDALTEVLRTEAEAYIKDGATPTYIRAEVLNAIANEVTAALDSAFVDSLTDEDYDQDALTNLILDTADAQGIDLTDYIKDGYDPFAVDGVAEVALQYINWDNVQDPAIIDTAELFETVLGPDGSLTDYITGENLSEYLGQIDLQPAFDQIAAGEAVLEDIVRVDELIDAIPTDRYGELFGLFDRGVLVDQLLPHAVELIKRLAAAPDAKEYLENIITPVLSTLVQNIDFVSVNGYEIAKEQQSGDMAGMLSVNSRELLQAIASLIPTLSELAETDGTLLSFNLYAEYVTVDGESRTKDVNVKVVLESGLETFRKVCAKLAQYITVTRNGNRLEVELTVPATVTAIYKKLLELDSAADLKKKLLSLTDKTGQELVDLFEQLTLDEILAQLEKADVEKLYSYITNIAQVETMIQRVLDKLGLDYSLESLQDLNNLLDRLAQGLPSLQELCDALTNRIGADVMAALEKVAGAADQAMTYEVVQRLLNKLYQVPKIGPFVENLLDENSVSEILEKYKDAEPVQAISDFIQARLDIDIMEMLQTMDANEIYDAALEKVAEYESYYERLRSFIVAVLDPDHEPVGKWQELADRLIPDAVLEKFLQGSFTGLYEGNGVFAGGVNSITVDTGYWSQRLLSFVERYVTLNDTIRNLVEGFLPTSTVTFGGSLTVNIPGLAEVTYLDADGNRLLTTYLPDGVDPAVAIDAPADPDGKTFLGWADASGALVAAVDGDVTLRPVYDEAAYTVTFIDRNGDLIAEFEVLKGQCLPALPAELPTAAELGLINGRYTQVWYLGELGGETVTEAEILAAPVVADVTYVLDYTQQPGDEFISSDAPITVTADDEGNWTVTVAGESFDLDVNLANGPTEGMKSLTVQTESGTLGWKLDEAVLSQLTGAAGADGILTLRGAYGTDREVGFGTDLYEYTTTDAYSFEILVDGKPFTEAFAGDLTVTLPYADALTANDEQKTVVYVLDGQGGAEAVPATVTAGVGVSFAAPHFSDYVIVNEYLITAAFAGQDGAAAPDASLNLDGAFVPAGATVRSVRPVIADPYGYIISSITYTDAAGAAVELARVGDGFSMPACATTVTTVISALEFGVYYVVGDDIYDNRAEAESALEADDSLIPTGYAWTGEWQGSTATDAVVYLTPELEAVAYTVTFEGVSAAITFTVEDYATAFSVPAVPAKTGMTGAWEDFESDPLKLIEALDAEGVTELTVKAVYTANEYQIFLADGSSSAQAYGNTVTLTITAPAGYTVGTVRVIELANNTELTLENNSFVMPAANVRVEVELVPDTIHYTVTNQSTGETQNLQAAFGSYASFTVQVPQGYVLSTAPNVGKPVSFTVNEDGSKTIVFAFAVTEEIADNTQITYALMLKVPATVRLAGGMPTTEEAPESGIKNLTFAGFAAPDGTRFEVRNYEFALFEAQEHHSLLWLWILIGVLVFLALIALIYWLHITGRIGVNFLTRFAVWLVSVFFAICLGISKVVLMIAQGTSKKEDVDFNAFGMSNPAPAEGPDTPKTMTVSEAVEADQAAAGTGEAETGEAASGEAEADETETGEATDGTEAEAGETEAGETEAGAADEGDAAGDATQAEESAQTGTDPEQTSDEDAEGKNRK